MHNVSRLLTRVFASGVLLVLLFGSQSAFAFNQDWGGWEYEQPTMMGGAPNSPTTMVCLARERNGQQCRICVKAYADDGTDKGYMVCGWTPTDESCRCDRPRTPHCRGMASCDYAY